jgi:hypothetical protein
LLSVADLRGRVLCPLLHLSKYTYTTSENMESNNVHKWHPRLQEWVLH